MESAYELYRAGCSLLRHGDHQAAIIPLTKARNLEPGMASVREALGRAFFGAQRWASAAQEFEAATQISPTDDYALFCLGRSMQQLGRHREACRALSLASSMRPEREDYRRYLQRSRAAVEAA